MNRPRLAVLFLTFTLAPSMAAATLQTFTDKAAFLAATGATSATGPLPDLGLIPSGEVTLGSITVFASDATGAFYVGASGVPTVEPDWYPGTPGNDMAFGFEDFEVYSATPIHALGFELVEPNVTMPPWGAAPVPSPYKVTLYNDDTDTLVGEFIFDAPDDALAFVGVWSDQAFTRATITDTTGDHDDEYFGEFWSGNTPAPPAVFTALALSGAAVPGASGVFTSFPQSPVLAASGAAFLGLGSAGSFGIYSIPGNPVQPIADLATAIPGGTGTFTGFTALAAAGGFTSFIGTGNGQAGVYLFDSAIPGNPVQPIADLTTAIPGGTGNFTAFDSLALAAIPTDPHRVAFIGDGVSQQGVYLFDSAIPGNPVQPVADLTTAIPGGTGTFTGFTALAAAGGFTSFIGTGSGQAGVYLFDSAIPGNPVQPIANFATPIPGGTGTFTGFTDLALVAIATEPHRVAFIGSGVSQQGVYLVDSAIPGNPVQPVADLTTPIPGGSGNFTGFTSLSASGAHTAFLGLGSGGQAGIYLASALTQVIAVGDTLDGKLVSGLRFGRGGLDGLRLTFAATFADASEGVYVRNVGSYGFAGFFAPVDNLPVVNQTKAGQAIPVKFSLSGDQGLDIFAPGYPKSEAIACDATAALDGIEQTLTAGGSSLSYDAASDLYTYTWKTDKAWAQSCRQLVVTLRDGTVHRANFSFK